MNSKDSKEFETRLLECGAKTTSIDFARLAVDPFHDTETSVTGSPDAVSGRSVVLRVNREITITGPGSSEWDCHLAVLPFLGSNQPNVMTAAEMTSLGAVNLSETTTRNGPDLSDFVHIATAESGVETFSPETVGDVTYSGLSVRDLVPNRSGSYRVISAGFQVHNTTAEIYKQGSVTTYEQGLSEDNTNGILYSHVEGGSTAVITSPTTIISSPPVNVAQAKQLQGVTWMAGEGTYAVSKIDHLDNTPRRPRFADVLMDTRQGTDSLFSTRNYIGGQTNPQFPQQGQYVPLRQHGAYFTGLSSETSLTVVMVVHLEVFPFPGETLTTLAHPSPPADYTALQCVDEIQRALPPGVQVKYNSLGSFFRGALNVLRTISRGANAAARVVPIPGLKFAADALSTGLHAADQMGGHLNDYKKTRKLGKSRGK